MKLGTLKTDSRDGKLAVVSKDLKRYLTAEDIAPNLQNALDNWDKVFSKLNKKYQDLNSKKDLGNAVDIEKFTAPLPRAYEWIDGSAYINHIILVRKARKSNPPETLRTDPLIYQGGSGVFLGPREDIKIKDESWGLDFEAEVVVYLGDTPQGTSKEDAYKQIKLVSIANDITLRNLIPNELAKGFGFLQSKPATAFAPFVATPDELGESFKDGRLHLPIVTKYNDSKFGEPNAGPEMHFSFHDLISHIAKSRSYTAGTILGSGTVSNEDRSSGYSCIAEVRMIEKIDTGEFKTPFMKAGDTVNINMFDSAGDSIFGEISQKVVPF